MRGASAVWIAMLTVLVAAPASSEVETEPAGEAGASPTPVEEPEAAAAEPPAPPVARVERGSFTTGMVEREARDSIGTLSNRSRRVLYFSEIHGASGETVTHRWEWNGKSMAEVSFEVEGPRWRVHSSKRLDPSWLGEWAVAVVDSAGRVLSRDSFTYTEAGAEVAPASEGGEEQAAAPDGETPPAAPEP